MSNATDRYDSFGTSDNCYDSAVMVVKRTTQRVNDLTILTGFSNVCAPIDATMHSASTWDKSI